MIKQAIALVAVSAAIIVGMPYAQQGSQYLVNAHEWVSQLLTDVFSGGQAGSLIRGLLALLCVPVIVSLVPALVYWIARRHWFPYFMEVVWAVWLLQAGAILVVQGAVT